MLLRKILSALIDLMNVDEKVEFNQIELLSTCDALSSILYSLIDILRASNWRGNDCKVYWNEAK